MDDLSIFVEIGEMEEVDGTGTVGSCEKKRFKKLGKFNEYLNMRATFNVMEGLYYRNSNERNFLISATIKLKEKM